MSETMDFVKIARKLAHQKHWDQDDKAGKPYVLHLATVAENAHGDDAKMVAWLHDIVEDTDVTLEDLRLLGFPTHVIEAVDAITRRLEEPNRDYMRRVAVNKLAHEVKKVDLQHNADLNRFEHPTDRDRARASVYRNIYRKLVRGDYGA